MQDKINALCVVVAAALEKMQRNAVRTYREDREACDGLVEVRRDVLAYLVQKPHSQRLAVSTDCWGEVVTWAQLPRAQGSDTIKLPALFLQQMLKGESGYTDIYIYKDFMVTGISAGPEGPYPLTPLHGTPPCWIPGVPEDPDVFFSRPTTPTIRGLRYQGDTLHYYVDGEWFAAPSEYSRGNYYRMENEALGGRKVAVVLITQGSAALFLHRCVSGKLSVVRMTRHRWLQFTLSPIGPAIRDGGAQLLLFPEYGIYGLYDVQNGQGAPDADGRCDTVSSFTETQQ